MRAKEAGEVLTLDRWWCLKHHATAGQNAFETDNKVASLMQLIGLGPRQDLVPESGHGARALKWTLFRLTSALN